MASIPVSGLSRAPDSSWVEQEGQTHIQHCGEEEQQLLTTHSWARHRSTHIYIQPCFFSLLKLIQEKKKCTILSECSLDQEEYHWELLQRSVLHAQAKPKLPHVSLLVAVLLLKSLSCSYCK